MATAKKLPSGSWRCQVLSHTEEYTKPDGTIGKRKIRKSFTCDDPTKRGKRICEQMAAEWAASKEQSSTAAGSLKFRDALEDYIFLAGKYSFSLHNQRLQRNSAKLHSIPYGDKD